MTTKEIYKTIRNKITDGIYNYDEQIMAISKWIESEFVPKKREIQTSGESIIKEITSYNSIFDSEAIEKAIERVKKIKYYISVDTDSDDVSAYCLFSGIKGDIKSTSILLTNTSKNKKAFDEEVKNLAKYFNAEILK